MRWATAVLAAVAALLLLPTVLLLLKAITGVAGDDDAFWWVFAVVVVAQGLLLWVAIVRLRREARAPGTPLEPSALSITGDELKIERAGRDRGMDYSWLLSEIADIRLCNAAPDRIFFSLKSLLAQAVSHDELIRVSVERPSGEIDDVMVLSAGRHWTEALEARLRAYLGLSPPRRGPAS